MTTNEKLNVCIRELLFGQDFLSKYKVELNELFQDEYFMQVVNTIAMSVPAEIEFSPNMSNPEFINFKKSTVNQVFFNKNLMQLSAYYDIVTDITKRGKTGLSATISVYYALRYMTLVSAETDESKNSLINNEPCVHTAEMISDHDYRKKWPAAYRCEDGHYVRSKNEQLVDNWLYHHNICHAYELLVVDKRDSKEYINDFYLPQYKLFIEVWGFETPEYIRRKERKIEVYRANNLNLLQMSENDVKNLDDFLRRNLSSFRHR